VPIRLVVNGYFRSGTTLLWDFFRRELPDHLCLYEPLHSALPSMIRREQTSGRVNLLHGRHLFRDYTALGDERLEALLRSHPNLESDGIRSTGALCEYLDHLQACDRDIVLQLNRASFFLDVLHERYGAPVVHVVRHPLDVFRSMQRASSVAPTSLQRGVKRVLRRAVMRLQFDLLKDYQWIERHQGYPPHRLDRWDVRFLTPLDPFRMLVLVWTVSNHVALAHLRRTDGLLLAYEALAADPEGARDRLARHLGRPMREDLDVRAGPGRPHDARSRARLARAVAALRIEPELREVCQEILKRTGRDYAAVLALERRS